MSGAIPSGSSNAPTPAIKPGYWTDGPLPSAVFAGEGTVISGAVSFKRLRATRPGSVIIGAHCTMEDVHFSVGESGRVTIGDYCYLTSVVLLCEMEIVMGRHVALGWNTTLADTDFHPLSPVLRVEDAIACSPLGRGRPHPPVACQPIIIEDDVWIGPAVAVLKGVRIGAGAWVEAGSVVTHDVPSGARVMGNPARVIGGVA
jgi:acetyltransferase-like isoleucine patch superfamily enzyme